MPSNTLSIDDLCFSSMELRVLRYFVATVDEGSETAAAERLHVTQPVLSRQLRAWERRMGLTLFERRGRRLHLTNSGQILLPLARKTLQEADAVEQSARRLAGGAMTEIQLKAPTTTLTEIIAPYIAGLGPDDPLLKVSDLNGDAESALAEGADLVITRNRPPRTLRSLSVARLPVWAYARPDHPWLVERNASQIDLAELVEQDLVLLTPGFRPRTLLDHAVDAADLTYARALECSNTQVALALAASGRGVAVVSDDPRFGLAPLRIRHRDGYIAISLFAAWKHEHHADRAIHEFARGLADFVTDRYGVTPA